MDRKNYVLSVVIPCYNEKNSIHTIVEKVRNAPIANKEIIIVDDKSTDGTSEILDREIAPLVSKVIHHEVNQGKGTIQIGQNFDGVLGGHQVGNHPMEGRADAQFPGINLDPVKPHQNRFHAIQPQRYFQMQ